MHRSAFAALLVPALISCGGSTDTDQPGIASVTVGPEFVEVATGATSTPVVATVLNTLGDPVAGVSVSWSTTPATLATIVGTSGVTNTDGEVAITITGLADGTGTLNATVSGVTGQTDISVNQLNLQVGTSTVAITRTDACANSQSRLCESLVGDVTADAMRETYTTDFALTHAGGLRADVTCPQLASATANCPVNTPPPYRITRGTLFDVHPFGTRVVTLTIDGVELKALLENAVSLAPAAAARVAQVAGLCFTYNLGAAVGSRVTSVVRHTSQAGCSATPVSLTAGAQYTIALNEFIATGGEGFTNFAAGRLTTRGSINRVIGDWIAGRALSPTLQSRTKCTGAGCPAGST